MSVFNFSVIPASAKNNLTDGEFFGVWTSSGWSVQPILNYSYETASHLTLSKVEAAVKDGDYSLAKEELLNYYIARKENGDVKALPITLADTEISDYPTSSLGDAYLAMNNIFSFGGCYKASIYVGNNDSQTDLDITGDIADAIINGKIAYMLFSAKQDMLTAEFIARGASAPVLTVTTDLTSYTVAPENITYIRAGAYSSINYGGSDRVYVREQGEDNADEGGSPFTDNTQRTYISFSLPTLSEGESVISATLSLTGKISEPVSDATKKEVLLLSESNTAWAEDTLTWDSMLGKVYSWQNVDSPHWTKPDGSESEYLNVMCRFGWSGGMTYLYLQDPAGNRAYGEKCLSLISAFIEKHSATWNRSLETGDRLTRWPDIFDAYLGSDLLTGDLCTEMVKFLYQGAKNRANASFNSYANWKMTEARGLYKTSIYFPEFTTSASWQALALNRIESLFELLYNSDMSYAEATTAYGAGTLTKFLYVKLFASLNGVEMSGEFDSKLNEAAKFHMINIYPDSYDINFGDSNYKDLSDIMADFAEVYPEHSEYLYFATQGKEGTPPEYTSVFYPVGQYAAMRSVWDPAETVYMAFQNYISDGHGHPDLLQSVVYAYGTPLIIDPGKYSYDTKNAAGQWLSATTIAHNTMVVDGASMTRSTTKATDTWETNTKFDFIRGSHQGYSTLGVTPTRSILFVKPGYFIVSDYLLSDTEHTYTQPWHFMPGNNVSVDPETKTAQTNFDKTANIKIVPLDKSLTESIENGLVYTSSLIDTEYLTYSKTGSTSTFNTVLMPMRKGEDISVTTEELNTSLENGTDASAMKINLPDSNGYYYISHTGNIERTFGDFSFDGTMAFVNADKENAINSISLVDGSRFTVGEIQAVVSPDNIPSISISFDDTALNIEGSDLVATTKESRAIAIYAPDTKTVTLNGQQVAFSSSEDGYVYAVCAIPSNLAVNKSVSATSIEQELNPPEDAVDGYIPTQKVGYDGWKAKETPASITVDLGDSYHLNRFNSYWECKQTRTYYYKIEVSDDNEIWTTVVDHTSNASAATETTDYIDSSITGRYVRWTITKCSSGYAAMREIEVYGWTLSSSDDRVTKIDEKNNIIYMLEGGYSSEDIKNMFELYGQYLSTDVVLFDNGGTYTITNLDGTEHTYMLTFDESYVPPTNLAFNKSVWASSVEQELNPPEDAVDGYIPTQKVGYDGWKAKETPASITVDLGSEYHLSRFITYWESKQARTYYHKIEVSNDNETWITAVDHTSDAVAAKETTENITGDITGRYVRWTITKCSSGYAAIREIEVYGWALTSDSEKVSKIDNSDNVIYIMPGNYTILDIKNMLTLTGHYTSYSLDFSENSGTYSVTDICGNETVYTFCFEPIISRLDATASDSPLSVSISVRNVPDSSKVFLAAYNSENILLNVQTVKLTDGDAVVNVTGENISYIKAFVWSSNLSEITKCVKTSLN